MQKTGYRGGHKWSLWIEKNPALFFPVIGTAYIPEHRSSYTDQGNGRIPHKSRLLAWLVRDFDAARPSQSNLLLSTDGGSVPEVDAAWRRHSVTAITAQTQHLH
jgi:hypothetical protein